MPHIDSSDAKGFAMGIKDFMEEAAGAFAADKALEAVDPEAGFLAKAAAAVAGFEGVGAIKEHLAGDDQPAEAQPEAAADESEQPQDDNSGN
ncbi:MAG: hypothetical protein JSR28_18155 [Proteobacteria bacterium]|nr:hypothetical protein [Pseudomonadota bacterium]